MSLRWTFAAVGTPATVVRYLVVMAVGLAASASVLAVGTRLGLAYPVAKAVSIVLTTCFNFVTYRRWVFPRG